MLINKHELHEPTATKKCLRLCVLSGWDQTAKDQLAARLDQGMDVTPTAPHETLAALRVANISTVLVTKRHINGIQTLTDVQRQTL